MAIVLRSVKGSNLTANEADGNIIDLDGRLSALEDNPPQANGIANVLSDGSVMTLVLDDSTEHEVTLPRPVQRPTVTTAVSASTLTPTLAQASALFQCTNVAGCGVTIPPNASVAYPVDTELHFWQDSDNPVLFTEGSGVTISHMATKDAATSERHAVVTAKKVSTNAWLLFGALAESVTA